MYTYILCVMKPICNHHVSIHIHVRGGAGCCRGDGHVFVATVSDVETGGVCLRAATEEGKDDFITESLVESFIRCRAQC